MKKAGNFFRTKIFYVALAVGLVAFASLVAVYNYQDAKKELIEGQAIDLNQPVEDSIDITAENEKKDEAEENKEPVAQIGKSNEAAESKKTEESTEETTESTEADEVEAASSNGATAMPKLNYNGEQELAWPLVGDVILPFSMDTTVYYQTLKAYKCNPGMLIRGDEGANVMSVYDGVVTDIYETKEHGTVVEIDMGNGYMATYGQLMNVCVSVGDKVSTDENIAELGPVSSYYVEEGTHLYFQITKDGEPVNPLTLIK